MFLISAGVWMSSLQEGVGDCVGLGLSRLPMLALNEEELEEI